MTADNGNDWTNFPNCVPAASPACRLGKNADDRFPRNGMGPTETAGNAAPTPHVRGGLERPGRRMALTQTIDIAFVSSIEMTTSSRRITSSFRCLQLCRSDWTPQAVPVTRHPAFRTSAAKPHAGRAIPPVRRPRWFGSDGQPLLAVKVHSVQT